MASQAWREEVLRIPSRDIPPSPLVTTLYLPHGRGPFPLWVFNHGKHYGPAAQQSRCQPLAFVRVLTAAGFAVAAPNRKGFADSGGVHLAHWRNPLSGALFCARDIDAAIRGLVRHPCIQADRIFVAGVSYGGLATLAYGMKPHHGVRALVNFSGGLRAEHEPGWQQPLLLAFRHLGRYARRPSLWFYGENDHYWSMDFAQSLHRQYVQSNHDARLINTGVFKSDAHLLVYDEAGNDRWWPHVRELIESNP
jgi:dienelactone hydrolase